MKFHTKLLHLVYVKCMSKSAAVTKLGKSLNSYGRVTGIIELNVTRKELFEDVSKVIIFTENIDAYFPFKGVVSSTGLYITHLLCPN